ncbi:MAG TPA: hypothetical protein VMV94_18825, partial [Phycisphaerae bacterium]|nr:hypothetical protein [Phycisphaerae bacterium]
TTCGAGDDCALRTGEEVIYAVNVPWDGTWIFSLCGSTYDTYMFVGTSCCGAELGYNDDYCNWQSQMTFTGLAAGTYYMDIEGYSGCGNYVFTVSEPVGACCVNEVCVGDLTQAACNAQSGMWYSGLTCASFGCFPWPCHESEITITYVPDSWPYETSWQLVQEGTGATICTNPPMTTAWATYVTSCCVTNDGCYDWNCEDEYGDGTYSPGGYQIAFNGTVVASTLGYGWYGSSVSVTQIGGCVFSGACCFAGPPYCLVATQPDCEGMGGFWLGAWTTCGPIVDCDGDGIIDSCAIAEGISQDCNENGVPDNCDIASGTSTDCQPDGIPDECQDDCNYDGIADSCDIRDCHLLPPDEQWWCQDCQPDGIPDGCQLGPHKRRDGLLYAPSEPDNPSFRAAVSAIIGAPVDYFDATSGTPTLAQMQAYVAVLTWVDYPYADPVTMGNNLADFADGGGTVILGQWCLPTAGNYLQGRIMTDPGYNPASGFSWGSSSYAGDGVYCLHSGVTSYEANYRDNISVVPGASSDGTFLDGVPAVAYWPGAYWPGSAPMVYYSPGNTGSTYTTGDWALLTANMVYCWIPSPPHDCNGNQIPDDCDIRDCDGSLWCQDCNENGYPDVCDPDCDGDGIPDACEIRDCPPGDLSCADCNGNYFPDGCDIADCSAEESWCQDCNGNGVPDGCDIQSGASNDCNDNGIPDDCESMSDCNGDGVPDICDPDCNENGISDVCDILFCDGSQWCMDCQHDGIPDGCQIGVGRLRRLGLLYAPSEADNPDFRMAVSALIGAPVDYFDARYAIPTLAQMMSYAAVLTWANYAYADTIAFGDSLADYVDGGGAVILGQWCLPTAGNYLAGRIMTEAGYNPATGSYYDYYHMYAGNGIACMHTGVASYDAIFRDHIFVVSGAVSDGTWTDGVPAVAYWNGGLPVFYCPGHTGDSYDQGSVTEQWALMTANILTHCVGSCRHDCNRNLIPDDCDIEFCDGSLWCQDCNENCYPDVCDPDCDADGIPDECEIRDCPPGEPSCADCNGNNIPDGCDIADCPAEEPWCQDCNGNGTPDACDIASGSSTDCNWNDVPDDCEPLDCNGDGIPDNCGEDCNWNGIPDVCDIANCYLLPPEDQWWCQDCQPDGILDGCEVGYWRRRGWGLLYAPSESDEPSFRATVSALLWGDPVDYFDARYGTPTVAQMQQYSAVLTWANYAYADKSAFGDNLADYVDTGGKVILGQWCLPTATNWLGGRIMVQPGYNPATASYWDSGVYAGNGVECIHNGVEYYEAGYRDHISVATGAFSDGTWTDGVPAVAYWPGFYPQVLYSPGNTGGMYSGGDWAQLTANMVDCYPLSNRDCNRNRIPDECDVRDCDGSLWCQDCNDNGRPDVCDPDCDGDGIPNACEIADCPPDDPSCADCNGNWIPDGCDVADCDGSLWCRDCNGNGILDACDIASGTSQDCQLNGIPDECEVPPLCPACLDCNVDGVPDECQLEDDDCDGDGIPDECDVPPLCPECPDCNVDGIPDACQLIYNDCDGDDIPDECDVPPLCLECPDCNGDGIPDACQLIYDDCDSDGIPDECEVPPLCPECPDCNGDGIHDACQLVSNDCNENHIPDECDIMGGFSQDCQVDGIPDECQLWAESPPSDVLVSQPPDRMTGRFADCQCAACGGGQQARAENFRIDSEHAVIGIVKVWGVSYPGDSQPTNNWYLSFYKETGTGPGDVVYSYVGAATMEQTGVTLFGGPEWVLTFEFAPPNPLLDAGVYWLAVYADEPGDDWMWEGGSADPVHGVLNHRYSLICPPSFVHTETGNLALELLGNGSGHPLNDCNENGIPDECDIQVAFGGFCEGTTYPPCDTDYDGNGVPDHCETCGDFVGTSTVYPYDAANGVVDVYDYWYIHDGLSFCTPHARYTEHALADMDGDGCITLVDYQRWLMCYRMASGRDFVVPKKRPLEAVPVPTQSSPRSVLWPATGGTQLVPRE